MKINQEHCSAATLAGLTAPAGKHPTAPPKTMSQSLSAVAIVASTAAGARHQHPAQKKLMAQWRDAPPRVDHVPPAPVDMGRVAANTLLSGVSLSSTFGLGSALVNMALLHPHPLVKVAGAYAPMVAGTASSYTEKWMRDAFQIDSTTPQSMSLVRDAATPVASMLVNYSYMFSKLPKFSPRTPAGLATSVTVCAMGSGIGGGAAELFAQTWHPAAVPARTETSQTPTTLQTGIGRSLTQLPIVVLNHISAASTMHGAVPRALSRAVPLSVGAPLIFRQSVTPTTPQQTSRTPEDCPPDH